MIPTDELSQAIEDEKWLNEHCDCDLTGADTDELLLRDERLEEFKSEHFGALLLAAKEVERLRRDLAAARKNEERYRFMREHGVHMSLDAFSIFTHETEGGRQVNDPKEMDAAIDTAISTAEGGGE